MIIYANGRLKATNPVDGETYNIETNGIKSNQLRVSDVDSNEILLKILTELRILNFQMSDITDNHITDSDVEGLL